jgi:predicted hotdog family 3-hydroxylacyl-ACP dehydratase
MTEQKFKNIQQIIPHRDPLIMIDNYRKIDNDTAYSQKVFTPDDYGCSNGYVSDSILVECIAQTVAAHYGYQALVEKNNKPGVGMLVSVDTFVFYKKVEEKAKIEIFISKTDTIGPFKLFKGKISIGEKTIAQGHIKVFNPDNPEKPKSKKMKRINN